jgi:hypothetical protein
MLQCGENGTERRIGNFQSVGSCDRCQGDAEASCYQQDHAMEAWELPERRKQSEERKPMMALLHREILE